MVTVMSVEDKNTFDFYYTNVVEVLKFSKVFLSLITCLVQTCYLGLGFWFADFCAPHD